MGRCQLSVATRKGVLRWNSFGCWGLFHSSHHCSFRVVCHVVGDDRWTMMRMVQYVSVRMRFVVRVSRQSSFRVILWYTTCMDEGQTARD